MKFEYIKEFVTLTEIKNYAIAADLLFISQPTLSRHIQELENELGIPLFDRSTHRISLTEGGKLFLPYANQALSLYSEFMTAINRYTEDLRGVLRVGSVWEMQQYGIVDLINQWCQNYPNIPLKISEGTSAELIAMLNQDEIDFAFIRDDFPETYIEYKRIKLSSDNLVCLLPLEHPLGKRNNLSVLDLKNENILFYEGSPLVKSLFLGAGFTPKSNIKGLHGANAIHQVRAGQGIMLQFKKTFSNNDMSGIAIRDIVPKIVSDINLLYRQNLKSDYGRLFINFIKNRVN